MSQADTLTPDLETPPAGFDDLYEVVNGRFVEQPPMGAYQNQIASTLFLALANHVNQHRLGRVVAEMLHLLDHASKLQRRPDISFVSFDRWAEDRRVSDTAAWDVVPDLAIEVVSPSNSVQDINDKLIDYFRSGVRSVWVIHPKPQWVYLYESLKRITIFEANDVLSGSTMLPEFRIRVSELFE